jgi:hypothetical protein
VESGLGRAEWDPKDLRDLGDAQTIEVAEDEGRAMVGAQSAERFGDGISLRNCRREVRTVRRIHREFSDVTVVPRQTSNIHARVNQDSAQPGVEAPWISELRQGAPRPWQGLLDGILTERSVVQDQRRGGIEAVDCGRRELLECSLITAPSLLDKIHPHARIASKAEA